MGSIAIDTNPRKQPRQARSRATVDTLLEAAAQVLVSQGYEGATTARVAERAGVSIGSLYQYFPNKEALVAALIERHAAEIVAVTRTAMAGAQTVPLAQALRATIRAGLDAHRVAPRLHKILVEQVPRVGRIAEAMDASRLIVEMLERLFRARADELAPGLDPAMAAFVVETALEALAHKAVIERPDLLDGNRIESEMERLVAPYLLGG